MEVSFKETELCLSLPGSGGGGGGGSSLVIEAEIVPKATGKRGFVDLELNLQSEDRSELTDLNETVKKSNNSSSPNDMSIVSSSAAAKDPAKPPAKAQVVGWPPVRSYRKNMMAPQKVATTKEAEKKGSGALFASFVKVSMDGAPYLRKVDLETFGSYKELSDTLAKMFSSFTMGNYGAQGMIDFMNESKLMDFLNSSDYVPTYEDKDGDWMLAGDVPWEMFVESCKRLRIMKGSEAIGIAPRAMEKCKSRN